MTIMQSFLGSAPSVSSAPTIGTATATAYNQATVTFTAPSYDGGSAITSYTAVSSPGGITGTLSGSGSGTITVNGLSQTTSYTFTVYATNAVGNSANSSPSNSITTPSNRVALNYTFSGNTANASLNLSSLGGYSSGKSDATITINSGVYLYATSTSTAALTVTGTAGDTVKIINNGYIMGQGGFGQGFQSGTFNQDTATQGGPGIQINVPLTIDNTNSGAYIGGGGGGGAGGGSGLTGGGGAGGGGGGRGNNSGTYISASNGAASPGGTGSNGQYTSLSPQKFIQSGGGGRVFPGTGGGTVTVSGRGATSYQVGLGGSAGGGGAAIADYTGGGLTIFNGGGGGGGWGASGGKSFFRNYNSVSGANASQATSGAGGGAGNPGGDATCDGNIGGGSFPYFAAGGPAVLATGQTVTFVSGDQTRVYGAISV